ncbi:hypothetical protein ACFV5N_11970 [Streptomyces sp. NPDC059853]|uniref:hypothetical protein n=1 Tax=Streptomyces sp. NPDC059853 TaxID=3346973 RepID=UPI00364EC950
MQRLLVRAGVWLVATGSAVTLSWFGVYTVLRGTVYDPPRAVPVRDASAWTEPDASSTHRPPQDPAAPPSGPEPDPGASAPAGSQSTPPPDTGPEPEPEPEAGAGPGTDGGAEPADPPPDTAGRVETVSLDGGRVVYELGTERCELVSATPEPGWEMQVWTTESYLRVTFVGHGREVSAFCTWHGYEPAIEVHEG